MGFQCIDLSIRSLSGKKQASNRTETNRGRLDSQNAKSVTEKSHNPWTNWGGPIFEAVVFELGNACSTLHSGFQYELMWRLSLKFIFTKFDLRKKWSLFDDKQGTISSLKIRKRKIFQKWILLTILTYNRSGSQVSGYRESFLTTKQLPQSLVASSLHFVMNTSRDIMFASPSLSTFFSNVLKACKTCETTQNGPKTWMIS